MRIVVALTKSIAEAAITVLGKIIVRGRRFIHVPAHKMSVVFSIAGFVRVQPQALIFEPEQV